MTGDLDEDPREPSLRVNLVELGSFDEGKGNGHSFAAALGA